MVKIRLQGTTNEIKRMRRVIERKYQANNSPARKSIAT